VLQPPALQVRRELLLHVAWQLASPLGERRHERRVVALDELIKKCRLRAVALVAWRLGIWLDTGALHARSLAMHRAAWPAAFLRSAA
jgi:hypothetical protein